MERPMILDEDEDTEGTKEATDRPLKKRKRQKVSTTIELSSKEGAQSVKALADPLARVKAGEGSREVIFSSLD